MKKLILPFALLMMISTVSANELVTNTESFVETTVVEKPKLCDLVKKGDYDGVKKLLDSGQKVDEKSNGLTPLMLAARYNKHKIAKLLIGYGADTKAVSENGKYTPLKMARLSKAKETYYVIKEAIDKQTKANS